MLKPMESIAMLTLVVPLWSRTHLRGPEAVTEKRGGSRRLEPYEFRGIVGKLRLPTTPLQFRQVAFRAKCPGNQGKFELRKASRST